MTGFNGAGMTDNYSLCHSGFFLFVIPDKRSAIRNPVLIALIFQGLC